MIMNNETDLKEGEGIEIETTVLPFACRSIRFVLTTSTEYAFLIPSNTSGNAIRCMCSMGNRVAKLKIKEPKRVMSSCCNAPNDFCESDSKTSNTPTQFIRMRFGDVHNIRNGCTTRQAKSKA